MKVLLVYAHPEPTSLNGSLRDFSVQRLQAAGHTVQVSDLYAMNWKATLDADDAPERDATKPFHASLDSKVAYAEGTQAADIAREQEKLLWADALILQFPLWWFTMPAILKAGLIGCTPTVLPTVLASIPTVVGASVMAKGK
jgi:NAD(P)H dehydrogenase (quinone)